MPQIKQFYCVGAVFGPHGTSHRLSLRGCPSTPHVVPHLSFLKPFQY